MQANQIRLYFASFAYVLMHALRRLGLEGTELARAQCGTIREKVLKIGAQIRVSVRKVVVVDVGELSAGGVVPGDSCPTRGDTVTLLRRTSDSIQAHHGREARGTMACCVHRLREMGGQRRPTLSQSHTNIGQSLLCGVWSKGERELQTVRAEFDSVGA